MPARDSPPTRKKQPSRRASPAWSPRQAADLYGIADWGHGFFGVSKSGRCTVRLRHRGGTREIALVDILEGLSDRGTEMPVLLRFRDILQSRITELNEAFATSMKELGYRGSYRGVYPIKVNQQRQVIEEITRFGRKFHYGLEAGSKPELIAALAYLHDPEARLICNGYKDHEFIDLALHAQQMGVNVCIVLEMPGELDLVVKRAKALGVRPNLGVRVRLATQGAGHWQESGGDRSVFGLSAGQIIEVVDDLRRLGYLDCLRLLHYHQGSQIPNIRAIREAASEAARIYVDLVKEGAAMGSLDIGGGLAVDYDGSRSNFPASCNYSIHEYCTDVVELIMQACDGAGIDHPDIISESGRAVVAYYSVLVFNILDVARFRIDQKAPSLPEAASPTLLNLHHVLRQLRTKNLLECFNDAVYYRDQIRSLHVHGNIPLRERATAEQLFWIILSRIADKLRDLPEVPEDLLQLHHSLHDFYYGNFSLFQSLPDSWAIDQLFPVMPLHRLDEEPTHRGVLADITCDCDGKIDRFIDREDVSRTLPLHAVKPGQDYLIGVFLVGAYQETLGDLHNLLGDTNVVGVHLEKGKPVYTHEVEGDTVADVLSYVEYDPKDLVTRFRDFAEKAVSKGLLSPRERRRVLNLYRHGLDGYTYFES